jgi:hypothetical protein
VEEVPVGRVDLDVVEADGLAAFDGVEVGLLEVGDVLERGLLGVGVFLVVERDFGRADNCTSASCKA